jgi:hypothetical protein
MSIISMIAREYPDALPQNVRFVLHQRLSQQLRQRPILKASAIVSSVRLIGHFRSRNHTVAVFVNG